MRNPVEHPPKDTYHTHLHQRYPKIRPPFWQDPAALKDLKLQRVRVDLDLPSNAMSARLRVACESSHADGSRTARSGNDPQGRGSNGKERRGRGGSGDETSGDVGVNRVVDRKKGGRNPTRENDGVPKVGCFDLIKRCQHAL